jgi:hypothetical protein
MLVEEVGVQTIKLPVSLLLLVLEEWEAEEMEGLIILHHI